MRTLKRMGDAIVSRGPDGDGYWLSNDARIGFAHRRLSIIDVSSSGQQPMISQSGRYILVYNGEIYNFPLLRAQLTAKGVNFLGHSDTEVLLAGIEYWGVEHVIDKLVGMFAFALWDCSKQSLTLCRDRFGEKPLYYGWQGESFIFGSTLNALQQHPDWRADVNRDALAALVRYNYVPGPISIFHGIAKLAPGTYFELTRHEGIWRERARTYWSVTASAISARENRFNGSFQEASQSLECYMLETMKGQVLSDVPLGALLSGGVDSATVVALMQSVSDNPVQTFTVGFNDRNYDESSAAESLARHLGTVHTTCMFDKVDVVNLVPRLSHLYDEPFADASQLPTALVSEVARRNVTVALSGDGGDELFGGYNRYIFNEHIWGRINKVSPMLRRILGTMIRMVPPSHWDRLGYFFLKSTGQRRIGDNFHKLAYLIGSSDQYDMYRRATTFWLNDVPVISCNYTPPSDSGVWSTDHCFTEKMMLADTLTYLPDDILVKVDRAAMGFSLETRAPMLDHRLFEFARSLPLDYHVANGKGKRLLRDLLSRYVPLDLMERPKSGFAIPIGDYLRGPLREWAEDLLDERRLRQEGYFDAVRVRQAWDQHLSRRFNREHELWSILMFQAWLCR